MPGIKLSIDIDLPSSTGTDQNTLTKSLRDLQDTNTKIQKRLETSESNQSMLTKALHEKPTIIKETILKTIGSSHIKPVRKRRTNSNLTEAIRMAKDLGAEPLQKKLSTATSHMG